MPKSPKNFCCVVCGETDKDQFYPYMGSRCKPHYYAYQKEYRQRQASKRVNKDKKYSLKKKYGMTPSQWEVLEDAQDGRCAICKQKIKDASTVKNHQVPHVDHSHDSGRVRSLLCNGCNRAIGYLSDSADRATAASSYLKFYQQVKESLDLLNIWSKILQTELTPQQMSLCLTVDREVSGVSIFDRPVPVLRDDMSTVLDLIEEEAARREGG